MVTLVDVDATWVNPAGVQYDAGELRRADAAMFVSGGVVRESDDALAVTVDGSDQVTVQPGSVVIPGNAVVGTGVYRTGLPSSINGQLGPRDATNPRIDLVVFRQLDTDVVGSHTGYTARVEVIEGVPSATPVAPPLPSMAVELGRITVPVAGGSAASVDTSFRTFACAAGGELLVATEARLPASAAVRQRARALDTGRAYEWNGSAWVSYDTGTTWRNVTGYQNGWGTNSFMRYRIDSANNLHIQGKLDKIGTHGATAFVLPAGFRPPLPEFLKFDAAAPQSTAENARINIDSAGNFAVFYSNPGTYISIHIVVSML